MVEASYSVGPVKKGDLFYYAHLDRESALKIGTRVRAGQVLGYAGDTGQGPEVTRGHFPPHLHLGWYDAIGSRSNATSGAMNPYPLLEWIKANGGAITGGSDVRYCQTPQTGMPTPSAGASRWPKPDSPGVRPDLDTGSHDPKPSPVIEESRHRAGHPVDVAKKAKPAGAGTPNEGHPPETAGGNKEQDREEKPTKDPEHNSRPPDEHTSPEEEPPASETTEPQTTGEPETDPESTVSETIEITTETTVEVTTTE
jgi:Peptidase family M23